MSIKKYIFLLIILAIKFSGYSQTSFLYNQSIEAYKNKDYKMFLKLTKQLDIIRPSHPTFTYNLASAYSLNGKNDEAISVLNELVLANNKVAFEDDPDFESIKDTEGFQKIKSLKASQNKIVENSKQKAILSEKDLHPEGLTYLSKHKLWLASSIRNKKIVSFDIVTGKCSDWFADCLYSVFALKADANQKYLWVVCSEIPEMKGFSKEMEGRNEILKIEIATKKIAKRFSVEGNHVFGDFIISKKGDVYISDSAKPLIYKISNDSISIWKDLTNEAFNLQGIAFNEDQTKIFIADYLKGIVGISLIDNRTFWFNFPTGTPRRGIDGLVFYKNCLIAIHNGVVPIRIIKYKLDNSNTQIIDFTILDNNREEFNEPALATVSDNKLYFFANSPWKFYDKNFQLDETKVENPKLFELSLN